MKIRQGFVSNSSSSSFIAVLDKKGGFSANGYGEVRAVVGVGFTAKYTLSEKEEYDYVVDGHGIFDWVHDGEGSGDHAFIRSFAQMKQDQTLVQFNVETTELFMEYYGERAFNIKGPQLLAAGSV